MIVAGAVYMLLQAMVMRWWLEGLRSDRSSSPRRCEAAHVGAYLRCFLWAMLMMTVLSIIMGE